MKSFDCKACKVSADRSIFLTKLVKKLKWGAKERTCTATVASKRMDMARFPTPESTWNYLITFTLEDGSKVELHTLEVIYQAVAEDETGLLTWEGENLLSFEKGA